MTVVDFTPVSALIGGALIGLGAALLWIAQGRLAGVSNIVGGVVRDPAGRHGWRLGFLAGLLVAGLVAILIAPGAVHFRLAAGAGQLAVAGLLVGFGTQLSNGCTSGHGVCGIGRLSARSIVATLCFMASGMATVFLMGHLL